MFALHESFLGSELGRVMGALRLAHLLNFFFFENTSTQVSGLALQNQRFCAKKLTQLMHMSRLSWHFGAM